MMRVLWLILLFVSVLFGGLVLLALLLWWLLGRQAEERKAQEIQIQVPAPGQVEEVPQARATPVPEAREMPAAPAPAVAEPQAPAGPARADDLKRIEGIGPKISSVLQAAGITTFAQLAATEVGRLEQILEEESPRLRRLADPGTWPEQARFAAAGDWQGLATLQSELKGGRRKTGS
jgi:predicted flap endonuclease-1-like 5' DNA nuclease